jgi:hypothetical protein
MRYITIRLKNSRVNFYFENATIEDPLAGPTALCLHFTIHVTIIKPPILCMAANKSLGRLLNQLLAFKFRIFISVLFCYVFI